MSRSLVVGMVAIAILVGLGAIFATWTDEEYSLATTAHGAAFAYGRAIGFEKQAPLYFVLLALWRTFDSSVFVARLFSVACIAGFLITMAALLRRVWPNASTLVFAAIAFNPFVVYAGTEIRLYAFALLVSSLLALTFYDGFFVACDISRGVWIARTGFVLSAIAAAYLQYYLMFALVGFGAALLVYRRQGLLAFLASCALVALAMVPLVGIVREQVGVDEPSRLGLIGAARIPLAASADYVMPLHWARGIVGRAAYAIVGLVAIGSIVAAQPRPNRAFGAFAIVAAVSALLFTLVGAFAHVYVIAPRQTVVLFAPLMLAVAALLATARRPLSAIAFGGAYALVCALSLGSLYGHGAKTGDWKRVGAALTREVAPGDAVAVFDSDAALPLQRYYVGSLVRVPRSPQTDVFRANAFVIHSSAEVDGVIGRARLGHHRLWLVRNNACTFRHPDYGCAYLDEVVRREYRVIAEHPYFESSIAELVPR